MHNFSYRKFPRRRSIFGFGLYFCRFCVLENVHFLSMRNICVYLLFLELCEASSQLHLMSVSFYRFQARNIAVFIMTMTFHLLMVLCFKLRYVLTGFFSYRRSNYVFAFFGWFLVGETSSKYCPMTVFCRVFFFYNYSF